MDAGLGSNDPIKFADKKTYQKRLSDDQAKTGNKDALRTGPAFIKGRPIMLAVMDFGFMGGSMGTVVGEKLTRAIERAIGRGRGPGEGGAGYSLAAAGRGLPLVVVRCSAGPACRNPP